MLLLIIQLRLVVKIKGFDWAEMLCHAHSATSVAPVYTSESFDSPSWV